MIKPGPGAGDRRRVCRYPAVLQTAYLGWWQDATFTSLPARLVDLSLNGCRLELDRLPALLPGQAVSVHLHKSSQVDWLESRIIAVRKPLLRKCEIRVMFLGSLGYEPFKRVVYGPDYLNDRDERVTPEHERDQFWK